MTWKAVQPVSRRRAARANDLGGPIALKHPSRAESQQVKPEPARPRRDLRRRRLRGRTLDRRTTTVELVVLQSPRLKSWAWRFRVLKCSSPVKRTGRLSPMNGRAATTRTMCDKGEKFGSLNSSSRSAYGAGTLSRAHDKSGIHRLGGGCRYWFVIRPCSFLGLPWSHLLCLAARRSS